MKVLHNGTVHDDSDLIFSAHNRAFRYGDSYFESIRLVNGKAVFLENHYTRLKEAARVLKMQLPANFTFNYFSGQVAELIQLNGILEGGRARLVVYRNDGGLYQPDSNEASWFMEVLPYADNLFALNEKGLKVDVYREMKKPVNMLSNLKTGNSLLFVMASLHKQKVGMDDLLLLNEGGFLCEATSSNMFLVQGNTLLTPSLASGCLEGTMRKLLLSLAPKAGLEVVEADEIGEIELQFAEEVFITTAVAGIKWVGAYGAKRYFNKTAKKLVDLLNEQVSG